MFVSLSHLIKSKERIAVAVSGGMDSMALLHYLKSVCNESDFSVLAINVEHGIRGEESVSDSLFVKEYCEKNGIPLISYGVDSLSFAKENKLSIEQSARKLRYDCFFDAINSNKCDKIATAHHLSDNAESVLFNILRGSGLKGARGIRQNFEDKIIRPFLSVSKQEIENYVKENGLSFVTDSTNFDQNYTRNFLRLKVIPEIKTVFPEVEESLNRFAEICGLEDDFMHSLALKSIKIYPEFVSVELPIEQAIFNRSAIIALQSLGVQKDWEKKHIDSAYNLTKSQNGASINLLNDIVAIKEYDQLVFYKNKPVPPLNVAFSEGEIILDNRSLVIKKADKSADLKSGLFIDKDKLPLGAVVRYPQNNDIFTKFGGGSKKLCDYFTDKKIPRRIRNTIPVLAKDNAVYAIFGLAVSNLVKVDQTTKTILQLKTQ